MQPTASEAAVGKKKPERYDRHANRNKKNGHAIIHQSDSGKRGIRFRGPSCLSTVTPKRREKQAKADLSKLNDGPSMVRVASRQNWLHGILAWTMSDTAPETALCVQ
jgi:hypothetical protein